MRRERQPAPRQDVPGRPAFRPAIQGLRAVAVIMVVLYHAGLPVPGGFTGVDVFFVISGFVIAEMLRREWDRTGGLDLRNFVRRRVLRLLPALGLVVTTTVAASALLIAPLLQPARTALTGLGALLLSANVVIAVTTGDYFDEPAESNPLLHLWSLSVEEQFYLVLPVLLLVLWRSARRLPRLTATGPVLTLLALAAGSFAIMLIGPPLAARSALPEEFFGFYSPVVRAWEFLAGVLLALTDAWRRLDRRSSAAAGVFGALLLLGSALAIDPSMLFPGPVTAIPVIGTILLIVSTEARQGRLHAALASRPFRLLGDRSYAWYLWHWPLIVLAGAVFPTRWWVAPAAALASLLPTQLSYRYVEEPIRRRGRPSVAPVLRRWLLVPAAIAGLAAVGASNAWFVPSLADAGVQVNTRSISQQASCHGFVRELPDRFDRCWFGDGDGGPIYLIGDSNASTFADAVVPAGLQLGRPVFAASAPACPPFLSIDASAECRETNVSMFEWLRSQPAGDVVIVATDTYWFKGGVMQPDVVAHQAAVLDSFLRIRAAGHRPVLVQPIPTFNGLEGGAGGDRWRLTTCTMMQFVRSKCGRTFQIGPEWPQQQLWRSAAALALEHDAIVIDLTGRICPEGLCRTDIDGAWLYRDGIHLSARAAAGLDDAFVEALVR